MICNACAADIEAESTFCRYCGARQVEPAPAADENAPAKQDMPYGILAALVGGAIVILVLISFISSSPEQFEAEEIAADIDVAADAVVADAAAAAALAAAEAAIKDVPDASGGWSYYDTTDKVRAGTSQFARLTSANTVYQAPPYDASTSMDMLVRKSPAHGNDVMLIISSGQMMCPSYDGCDATVRFDDGPAETISLSGPDDNSSETVFVDDAASFIRRLKKARRVVIEKTLYQAGAPQFEFDVTGFKWE
jgi:hypothetical protein